MATPTIILDGVMPYGTSVLTINSIAYNVEDEKITPEWKTAESLTVTGGPDRMKWQKMRYKYDATLQLATDSTAYPIAGDTFTRAVSGETSAVPFVVIDVPIERNNSGDIIVSKISAVSYRNAITKV